VEIFTANIINGAFKINFISSKNMLTA